MAGCGKLAATITLGPVPTVPGGPAGPDGLAVDDATHTLYVADNHDGDMPGTLTLVNTATCNGFVTSGVLRPRSRRSSSAARRARRARRTDGPVVRHQLLVR